MARKNQVWATLSDEVYAELENLTEKERRPMAQMVAILIESALKERKRKRKNVEEDNS